MSKQHRHLGQLRLLNIQKGRLRPHALQILAQLAGLASNGA